MPNYISIYNPTSVPIEDFVWNDRHYFIGDNTCCDVPEDAAEALMQEFPNLVKQGSVDMPDIETEDEEEEEINVPIVDGPEPNPVMFDSKEKFETALRSQERYDCSICATDGVQTSFPTHHGLQVHLGVKHK